MITEPESLEKALTYMRLGYRDRQDNRSCAFDDDGGWRHGFYRDGYLMVDRWGETTALIAICADKEITYHYTVKPPDMQCAQ